MQNVHIYTIPNSIIIIYDKNKILLPEKFRKTIEENWNLLRKQGKNFFQGDVYAISKLESSYNNLTIHLKLSNYAHYIYTIYNKPPIELCCRVVYTCALVETIDGHFVFGEMANHTSTPKRLQCAGGGIENSDIKGDFVDLNNNIKRELFEEMGIDINDKSITLESYPKYLKTGGSNNFISIIFKVKLSINKKEMQNLYKKHINDFLTKGVFPEFNSLVFVRSNPSSVKYFLTKDRRQRVDYLKSLLEIETGMNNVQIYLEEGDNW